MTKSSHYTIIFAVAIIVAIALNVWLDSGCKTSGVVTWHGKVCFK